jgi:pyruvate/2-oxoglutarate dehydrogenase complex dihydrolipoamide dehydrogenase (E3) component
VEDVDGGGPAGEGGVVYLAFGSLAVVVDPGFTVHPQLAGDVIAARANGRPDDQPGLRDSADDRGASPGHLRRPQVCTVGRTESQARAVDYDMAAIHGAYLEAFGYTGRAKMVVNEDRRMLLGATFVGPATVDLLHSATIAVNAEVPLDRLWAVARRSVVPDRERDLAAPTGEYGL